MSGHPEQRPPQHAWQADALRVEPVYPFELLEARVLGIGKREDGHGLVPIEHGFLDKPVDGVEPTIRPGTRGGSARWRHPCEVKISDRYAKRRSRAV